MFNNQFKFFFHFLTSIAFVSTYFSCHQNTTTEIPTVPIQNIELTPYPLTDSSIAYSNVLLQNYTYTRNQMMFRPENLRLGGMTPITEGRPKSLPRTNKGNHLHLCIDNKQHHVSNSNIFELPLSDGKYKLIAFIARSFYESIKNPQAIIAKEIGIRKGELYHSKNISTVQIAYNAPMGTYTDGEAIILDFVLVNTKLEKGGNQVKITINNEKAFTVNEWQAYLLEGLSIGEYEVLLELLDATGKQIAAPVSQKFIIKAPVKHKVSN